MPVVKEPRIMESTFNLMVGIKTVTREVTKPTVQDEHSSLKESDGSHQIHFINVSMPAIDESHSG
jgi:hypothetical protein